EIVKSTKFLGQLRRSSESLFPPSRTFTPPAASAKPPALWMTPHTPLTHSSPSCRLVNSTEAFGPSQPDCAIVSSLMSSDSSTPRTGLKEGTHTHIHIHTYTQLNIFHAHVLHMLCTCFMLLLLLLCLHIIQYHYVYITSAIYIKLCIICTIVTWALSNRTAYWLAL
ncbi:hypothetical protein PGIGA_G00230390, partial [Pangasianodon gigas]|nr:hypothetical protein [Pangasianodon gigas]